MKCVLPIAICLLASCHNADVAPEIKKVDSIKTVISTKKEGEKMPVTGFQASKSMTENLMMAQDFTVFFGLMEDVHLDSLLRLATGPYTLFLPDNDVFKKQPGLEEGLSKPAMRKELKNELLHHIVEGRFMMNDLKDGQKIVTLAEDTLLIYRKGDSLTIGKAQILKPDQEARNGIIQVVNQFIKAGGKRP